MPQPFRSKLPIQFGPGKILERPELAAHIANIIADWRNVEEILELMYGQILRASISKNRQSHKVTDVLSKQIFESIYILNTKLNLITKALKTIKNLDLQESFKSLCPDIRKRSEERNKIVHNTWGICDDLCDVLVLYSSDGIQTYKLRDFTDISARIQQTSRDLMQILSKLPSSYASPD